jgi:excisionase family DNA binding protein
MVAESPILTVEEAAVILRLSRGTAYEAVRRGDIPTIRIGRRLLVPRARLMAMLGAGDDQKAGGERA